MGGPCDNPEGVFKTPDGKYIYSETFYKHKNGMKQQAKPTARNNHEVRCEECKFKKYLDNTINNTKLKKEKLKGYIAQIEKLTEQGENITDALLPGWTEETTEGKVVYKHVDK